MTGHLLGQFENLGDNCEFGLAQRHVGLEPLGLLRFAYTPMEGLLDGLASDFDGLKNDLDLRVDRDPNDEVMMISGRYRLRTHTRIFGRHGDEADIQAAQARNALFLRHRFLEDLSLGDKILVRKGEGSETLEAAKMLLRALRAHGPNTLLWVVPQDETHPAGSVEVIEPGLLCGRISRFAPYDRAVDLCLDDWLEICQGAQLLRLIEAAPGEVRLPGERHVPGNVLPESERMPLPWWQPRDVAAAAPNTELAPPVAGAAVLTLRTREVTNDICVFSRYVPDGLSGGASYVVSMQVWIPDDFMGAVVGMVFDGFASVRLVNADLDRRNCWQRVWAQTRIPAHLSVANPSVIITGPAGSVVHMCCWKLELGFVPSEWRPAPEAAPDTAVGTELTSIAA